MECVATGGDDGQQRLRLCAHGRPRRVGRAAGPDAGQPAGAVVAARPQSDASVAGIRHGQRRRRQLQHEPRR